MRSQVELFEPDKLYYVVSPLGGGYEESYVYDNGSETIKKVMYANMKLGVDRPRGHVCETIFKAKIEMDRIDIEKITDLNNHIEFFGLSSLRLRTSFKDVTEAYPHIALLAM